MGRRLARACERTEGVHHIYQGRLSGCRPDDELYHLRHHRHHMLRDDHFPDCRFGHAGPRRREQVEGVRADDIGCQRVKDDPHGEIYVIAGTTLKLAFVDEPPGLLFLPGQGA